MKKTILFALLLLLAVVTAQAQDITVNGTVISGSDEEPLIGASIRSVATNAGTATDIDGNFTIKVPQGSDLVVSYIGYETMTLKAEPSMIITMKDNATALDEIVVVGYTVQRKADLTGAVAVMDLKEPLSENSGNILNSMAGKLPGVNVVPDAAPVVQVRSAYAVCRPPTPATTPST